MERTGWWSVNILALGFGYFDIEWMADESVWAARPFCEPATRFMCVCVLVVIERGRIVFLYSNSIPFCFRVFVRFENVLALWMFYDLSALDVHWTRRTHL